MGCPRGTDRVNWEPDRRQAGRELEHQTLSSLLLKPSNRPQRGPAAQPHGVSQRPTHHCVSASPRTATFSQSLRSDQVTTGTSSACRAPISSGGRPPVCLKQPALSPSLPRLVPFPEIDTGLPWAPAVGQTGCGLWCPAGQTFTSPPGV